MPLENCVLQKLFLYNSTFTSKILMPDLPPWGTEDLHREILNVPTPQHEIGQLEDYVSEVKVTEIQTRKHTNSCCLKFLLKLCICV